MQENKFSGILGLCLYAKPNSCMQLWNQFSQPWDIFFDILSMSFPCSHRWYLSACRRLPLLGIWKLKQKSMWLNKTEHGPIHLILCSHKGYSTIRFTYDNIKWGKLCGVFFDEGVNISRLDALAMKMILNTCCSTVGNTIPLLAPASLVFRHLLHPQHFHLHLRHLRQQPIYEITCLLLSFQ